MLCAANLITLPIYLIPSRPVEVQIIEVEDNMALFSEVLAGYHAFITVTEKLNGYDPLIFTVEHIRSL